ncbi:MAG TPA: NADH-quinone oxidoreductase subunit C [Propionibacteriaceae bacterium]|nr:NADH-quinone oxidoreductase subunit C [Propionibacteriaceae bacterium]
MTDPTAADLAEVRAAASAPAREVTRQGMWGQGSGDTSGYGGVVRRFERFAPSDRPYGSYFDEVVDRLRGLLPSVNLEHVVVAHDELTVFVGRADLLDVLTACRDDALLRFEVCVSVSGIHFLDMPGEELHVVYHLLSITHNRRVRLQVTCADADPHVPSAVSVYPMTDWHERETYDMFGVVFDGHPALTRILMPDDWDGFPQRKDYPLGGVPVEYKGAVVPPPDQRRSYS